MSLALAYEDVSMLESSAMVRKEGRNGKNGSCALTYGLLILVPRERLHGIISIQKQ